MLIFNSLTKYIVVSLGIQMKMHSHACRWHHCTRWNKITMKYASSLLEQPVKCQDRGAWLAAVYGVAQSRTRLKRLSSSSSSSSLRNHNASFWNRKMMCRKMILIFLKKEKQWKIKYNPMDSIVIVFIFLKVF